MKTAIWCCFPLSAGITSWAISATWPVEASGSRCYRPGSGMWLVGCRLVVDAVLVGPRGRVGLVTPTPTGCQRPSTGAIRRPISRTNRGVGFCPLDRAVLVNPGLSLQEEVCLVVLIPQHTAPNGRVSCMKRAIKWAVVIHPQRGT
jgi:hypothetical protein